MKEVRDEVIELFKVTKAVKFFVSPCFACRNMTYDSDGDCYSHCSYPICEQAYDFSALEYFTDRKKTFPYCEAPKMCHRKGLFRPTRFSRGAFDEFDGIGFGIWNMLEDLDHDAPSIAGSTIGFHRRMADFKA